MRKQGNEMVKDVNGQILWDGVDMTRRWGEYFEQVMNVEDVRQANIRVVGICGCQCWEN